MVLRLVAHHGTNLDAKNEILKSGHFIASQTDGEWAGSGIYFFTETDSYNNAIKWARYKKRFQTPAVITANIEIDSSKLFDLTDHSRQAFFHRMRSIYFEAAVNKSEQLGAEIDERIFDKFKLDCKIINDICVRFNYLAVKKDVSYVFYAVVHISDIQVLMFQIVLLSQSEMSVASFLLLEVTSYGHSARF